MRKHLQNSVPECKPGAARISGVCSTGQKVISCRLWNYCSDTIFSVSWKIAVTLSTSFKNWRRYLTKTIQRGDLLAFLLRL